MILLLIFSLSFVKWKHIIASYTKKVCFHYAIFFFTPISAMEICCYCVTSNVQWKHSLLYFFLMHCVKWEHVSIVYLQTKTCFHFISCVAKKIIMETCFCFYFCGLTIIIEFLRTSLKMTCNIICMAYNN